MTLFQGLSAFPITPSAPDGKVLTDDLRALVRRLVDAGVDSVGLLGSTGTSPYLDRDQRAAAVRAGVEEAAGRVPVMVGIGALSTQEVLRLAHDAQEAGADAVLLAPISYVPLTEQEVYTHYETVAGALDIPLCVYNNPAYTHFTFSSKLIARLSEVPRIAAVKNPAPAGDAAVKTHLAGLRAQVTAGFSCGYAIDWLCAEAMLAGADAWYSVLSGLFPDVVVPIARAARAGDHATAREHHARLQPLWELLLELGSLRVVYAAANQLGITTAQPPLPLLPLAEADRQRVARTVETLGLA
ncbi:dihydrodipicolinate synthase family protein [Streptoalloteichus hindustanus]|nr:dihydrodipicolinate synthase family protein [Streptoalloteichus hindustanus]